MTSAIRSGVPVLGLLLALLSLWLPLGSLASPPTTKDGLAGLIARYDSASCRECHEDVHQQWEQSHHARSLMGMDDWIIMGPYLKGGPLAIKDPARISAAANFPCAKCHLPQLMTAPDQAAAELARAVLADDKSTVRKLNIGCVVCHGDKAVVHGRPEPGVLYGGRDIPDHPGRPVKKSPFLKSALFCGQCHGQGPVLDFETPIQCATLYGSYLHAYIPSGGSKTCQDCHMPGANHYMPPNFNNRPETAERLRQALPLEVQAMAYRFRPQDDAIKPLLVVRTKITNRAGHRIPDG